ncbi:MAG: hypothetical protein EOO02_15165 [Chitinophagaceae bacterium]|nr:MAG: hypothetical protein EOO02_15165 [Chitinophagaceae bacterium]
MIVTRLALLSDLIVLNNGHNALKEDPKKYNFFVETLEIKFSFYIRQHPDDKEVFLLWCVFKMLAFHDEDGALRICRRWWDQTRDPLAVIFHCFIVDEYRGGITQTLFLQIRGFREHPDGFISSMSLLYMALYCKSNSHDSDESSLGYLRESVAVYPCNVRGYFEIAENFAERKQMHNAALNYKSAITRVETLYTDSERHNLYSGARYLKEMILWCHCTPQKIQFIKERLKKVSPF